MCNQLQIKSIILDFENKYPVDQWNIGGVDIWPNIRFKLYFYLLNHFSEANAKSAATSAISKKSIKPKNKIILRLKQLVALLKYYKFQFSMKKADYVFMGLKMHRVFYNGKWYNRFFDPVIDKYKQDFKFIHFEMDRLIFPIENPSISFSLPDLLQSFSLKQKIKTELKIKDHTNTIVNAFKFEDFYSEVSRQSWYSQELKINLNYWMQWAIKVSCKKSFFIKHFKKSEVKGVLIASYYGYEDTAAAIIAAKELSIPIADFQHGPQTNVHMAYSCWSSLPEKGYNTMPSHYWCWDQISSDNINQWEVNSNAKALGNTWIQHMVPNETSKSKKYIMYSLQVVNSQNIKSFFTKGILDLMKTTSTEWKIRIHPRSTYKKDEIEKFLSQTKVPSGNYHLEMAFDKAMVDSLYETKIHITNFSGCLIEAHQLGVPSLIIDEIGYEFYSTYIKVGQVEYKNKYDPDFKETYLDFLSNSNHFISNIDPNVLSPQQLFKNHNDSI